MFDYRIVVKIPMSKIKCIGPGSPSILYPSYREGSITGKRSGLFRTLKESRRWVNKSSAASLSIPYSWPQAVIMSGSHAAFLDAASEGRLAELKHALTYGKLRVDVADANGWTALLSERQYQGF